ncbi:MAG TPA: TonB-dependent receptor [Steroidobacteraceae bacterium]|jgi:outer membrane receptor protein involved in Fe transport|nr:TonB-dependent receptor [Steroidobacteraceae bacterium]
MKSSFVARTATRPFSASAASVLSLAVLGFALGSAPALADPAASGPAAPAEAPPRSGGDLEEIVVTAEKRESTVQATPISMTAMTGGDLAEQNISSVQDLVGKVPGISLRTAGPGQTEYEMRGLGSSGGSVATVGFYIDETPLSASAVALNGRTVIDADLFDLNHTEVLRGPQGTLYGAGSMGGTIKLVTNQPKLGSFEGNAAVDASQTTGGSTNGSGNLMLNFPIGDIAALRVVTTDKYISGWIDRKVIAPGQFPYPTNFGGCGPFYYCTRGNVEDAPVAENHTGSNRERFISSRASLLIQPADNFSATGNFMYQRIDADGYANYQSPPATEAIYQPYDVQEPYYDAFHMWSLKLSYDMPFANLTSASSYWQRDVYQSTDSTEALQNIFNYTAFVPNLYSENDDTWQIAQELRLTSRGDGDLQWVGGLYYSNLHSGYVTHNQTVGFVTTPACPYGATALGGHCPASEQFTYGAIAGANPQGIMFDDNNPNILNQKAIFGEISYKLRPDLKLTTGLRFYKFDISNESNQRGLGTASGNDTPTISSASGTNTSLLPKVNLSYEPTPDLTLYSTVSKGSRPGGVNLPIPLNPSGFYYCGPGTGASYLTSQPAYYAPDDIWSGEVGEKAKFADRRFTLNADIFYVKWHNIQQLIVLSCGYPYNTNVGDAKTYGPEVEMAARLTDELTVDLAGAYTQAYISAPKDIPGLPITPGERIDNIPKYTGNMAVSYESMLPQNYQFTARLAEAYVGPVSDVAYYRETLGSYGLMDFRMGVGKNAWTASVFGTNLTNKHAALTIDNTVFAWQQPTITRVSTNQPRTIGLGFQTKF